MGKINFYHRKMNNRVNGYLESRIEDMSTDSVTPKFMMPRLCTLMFLLYIAYGAVLPIMTMYMHSTLHFSGSQTGLITAAMSISAFASPLIGVFLVDKIISAERMFVICQIIAAISMYFIRSATEFHHVLILYIIYYAAFGPTMALSNAIAFHNLPNARDKFGFIRVWGTIAWIFVGVAFSYLWLRDANGKFITERLADCFTLAAITSGILAVYGMTMPNRFDKNSNEKKVLFPASSFKVFMNPRMALVGAGFCMISAVGKYYYFGASIYLKAIHVQEHNIMPLMAIGQIPEIIGMLFLSKMLRKYGCKKVFLLGLITELWRCGALMWGANMWIVASGLLCHGFSYSLFITTTFVFLENFCTRESRSGAHQLFSILNSGFANLIGSVLAGQCLDWFTVNSVTNFQKFWAVPLMMTTFYFVLLLIFFKPTPEENSVKR